VARPPIVPQQLEHATGGKCGKCEHSSLSLHTIKNYNPIPLSVAGGVGGGKIRQTTTALIARNEAEQWGHGWGWMDGWMMHRGGDVSRAWTAA